MIHHATCTMSKNAEIVRRSNEFFIAYLQETYHRTLNDAIWEAYESAMANSIQQNFGEKIIEAVTDFAKNDIKSVADLEGDEFYHVSDRTLRKTLAETFYGSRWIYKLGLALLVRDVEQMAHVRAQVLDYGAVCEGLLSDALLHAIVTNRMQGQKYNFYNFNRTDATINWNVQNKLRQISRQSFYWHIAVAFEESIINQPLYDSLDVMRKERNTVHMRARARGRAAYLGTSQRLFDTTLQTVEQTKSWRAANA